VLRAALPVVVAVQRHLFGEAGLPGGTLLKMLSDIDRNPSVK